MSTVGWEQGRAYIEAESERSNVMNNAHPVAGASRLAEYVTAMGSGAAEEERFAGVDSNLRI